MEKKNESPKIGTFFKNLFLKNLSIKIVSILFATVLWGIVLTVQNPERIKVLSNVPVSFEGASALLDRNLVVRGNPLGQLQGVTMRVSTPITNYMALSADQLSAYISLNRVTSAGSWTLPINPSPLRQDTRVESVSPENVTLEIDTLMTKPVPVEAYFEGTLPEGYWAAKTELSRSSVDIRGPKTDVERVTRAICKIQMTNRTQSYNDAVAVVLLDENGNEMDSSLFLGNLPSVIVKMTVTPRKTVPFDVIGSLLGADNLPANYRLYAAAATPETMDIAGEKEVLDGIASLKLAGLDVAGKKESIHQKLGIIVPEGVTLLSNSSEVDVFVDIREKTSKKNFEAVPIQAKGLGKKLKATFSQEATDISVEGRVSLVDLLGRDDVQAFVDVTGLKEGTYELYVSVYINDDATTLELTSISSVAQVQVVISKA